MEIFRKLKRFVENVLGLWILTSDRQFGNEVAEECREVFLQYTRYKGSD
jgi:hypothetical protein